jgi:hypothetical protein
MGPIQLTDQPEPAQVFHFGDTGGVLPAGRHLDIREHSGGPQQNLLDYQVPAGKVAHVRVSVAITETDA